MWYDGAFLFRLYGLTPDFSIIGKGFPGGEYPASKIITNKDMDTLNQFGADAYDCVYALYQALMNAGYDGTWSTEEITKTLTAQFTSMTFDGITGLSMTWGTNGEVSKAPKAVIIKDGVYVSMD